MSKQLRKFTLCLENLISRNLSVFTKFQTFQRLQTTATALQMWLGSIYVHIVYIVVEMTVKIYDNLSTYNESGNIRQWNFIKFTWFPVVLLDCSLKYQLFGHLIPVGVHRVQRYNIEIMHYFKSILYKIFYSIYVCTQYCYVYYCNML